MPFTVKKQRLLPLDPHKTNALVITGVYRFSRNPMYLGLVCLLVAETLWFNRLFGFLIIWGFIYYLTRFQILPEEKILEQKFGKDYQAYQQKVPRWLW